MSVVRLDWVLTHDAFKFSCHMFMHFSCISLSFLSYSKLMSLFLSLSVRQTALWHPNSVNPFRIGTLFKVPGHPFLFPLFTSGSVMRRPKRTSLWTSKFVAFIQNARLFCRILLTLLSSKLFGLEIENLYLRDPRGVLSCLFRSFTPTYTASISMCLSLLLHLKVHVS